MDKSVLAQQFYAQDKDQVLKTLGSSAYGLKPEEVTARLELFGANQLVEKKKKSLVVIFLRQFNSVLVYILFAAALVSGYFDHMLDAIIIVIVVIINAVFGFVQEYRSEKAVAALKKLIKNKTKVIRDGRMHEIEVKDLVPGDIMFVESGDKVPADGRVIDESNLLVNEASLTGESVPQHKKVKLLPEKTSLPERKNMVFSGTVVVNGEGRVVITSTGQYTELGKIATDVDEAGNQQSTFTLKVNRLGRQLGFLAIGAAIILMGVGFWKGFDWFDVLLLGVAAAVSAIPEGLPVVLAVVLAIGVQRMARKNAIVKNLSSIEPLGMAKVICTDKTGTLTKNIMTVTGIYVGGRQYSITGTGYSAEGEFWSDNTKIQPLADPYISQLLRIGSLTNRASIAPSNDNTQPESTQEVVGDPTEVALVVAADKAGFHKHELQVEYKMVDNLPFSSELKYQAALYSHTEHEKVSHQIFAIGAYEAIVAHCDQVVEHDKVVKLSEERRSALEHTMKQYAAEGYRVIVAATRNTDTDHTDLTHKDIDGLTFVGMFAIIDPPREEVPHAIEQCKTAGIRLVMITGDNKDTAVAIGKQIGLIADNEDLSGKVFTDTDVADLSDKEFLAIAKKVRILARVSPATKLRLVQILQEQGDIVAMTGDGVNDAPALKAADIGVSMGKVGTDVARESSKIVLSDDNFASLVRAIREGRVVFNNVRRTTGYLVTTNAAELITLVIALLIGLPLPLLPIHVLLLNLVTDGTPVISLATEPDHGDVLSRPPLPRKTNFINKEVIHLLIINSVLMAAGTFILSYPFFKAGSIETGRTIVFTTMSLFQSWNIYNMRSMNKSVFGMGFFTNKYVNAAFIFSLGFVLLSMYTPWLAKIFSFTPLEWRDWLFMIPVSFSVIIAVEVYKYFMFKSKRSFTL